MLPAQIKGNGAHSILLWPTVDVYDFEKLYVESDRRKPAIDSAWLKALTPCPDPRQM